MSKNGNNLVLGLLSLVVKGMPEKNPIVKFIRTG